MKRTGIIVLTFACCISLSSISNAQTLKKEPPAGSLPAGSSVLVDDGTGGKGKIKQVTAGSNMQGGQMTGGGSPRTRKCIPKS